MLQKIPGYGHLVLGGLDSSDPLSTNQAFEHWELAKSGLAHITEVYLQACVALDDACTSSLSQATFPCWTETSYHKVDTELRDLGSIEEKLRRSRTALAKIRNRSRVLAPISTLPSEILAGILCADGDECLRTCFAPTHSLSRPKPPAWASVCTQWHQFYHRWHISSSHLDLVVGEGVGDAYYHYAETVAGRSPDTPLHLIIQDRPDKAIDYPVSSDEIARLIRFIAPLMPRVCGLDFTFRCEGQLLLDSMIACWVGSRPAASPRFFKVWNNMNAEPLLLGPPTEAQISPMEYQDFFGPLQTFALQQCYVPSDSCLFRELTSLHLDWSGGIPTPLNLLETLAASPGLRTLSIDDVHCVRHEGSPKAVSLGALKNLSLSQYQLKNSLNRILPLINCGSNSISLANVFDVRRLQVSALLPSLRS
ncbi:hypothetical protein FRC08_004754 [Ceratobasidium sp. 394]|nr:hypothetical protein FRC08_004754 [Ceratobasidium sp. 394]